MDEIGLIYKMGRTSIEKDNADMTRFLPWKIES